MQIRELEIYGIPRVLVESWRRTVGEQLLPLQETAIREYGLMEGGNLVISAPTSSGKTFCGELAMARALVGGKKALCLVPLKALAEERYEDFRGKYAALGLKTIVSTSERREHERDLERGEFNLAVVIFEKFNQLLVRNLDLLLMIDLILIDELQMLGDDTRGATLELALLKTARSQYGCRLIGLSAVLAGAQRLAEWLNARLLSTSYRPVDLHQGILWDGEYAFRKYNSGETGRERWLADAFSPEDVLVAAVRKAVADGDQVLVFLKSKAACHGYAERLSGELAGSAAEQTLAALGEVEETSLTPLLMSALQGGVAFHHADLSLGQKRAVERGYRAGEIKVLLATTTLALGMNLPAGTVFLEPYKFKTGGYTKRPTPQPLSWPEYENMSGRAGRLRYASRPGRAVILVNSEFEKEALWSRYVLGRPAAVTGHLGARELSDTVLDLVASGCVHDRASLEQAFTSSFSGQGIGSSAIDRAIAELCEQRWAEESAEKLTVSALGREVSACGVGSGTARRLTLLLRAGAKLDDLAWLYEWVDAAEMETRTAWPWPGQDQGDQMAHLLRRAGPSGSGPEFRLSQVVSNPELQDFSARSKLALAMALLDWCSGRNLCEIERESRVLAGGLVAASETAAWLAESTARLAAVLRLPRNARFFFRRIGFSLRCGLPLALRRLFRQFGELLTREELCRLHARGVRTARDLARFPVPELDLLLGRVKALRLREQVEAPSKTSNESLEEIEMKSGERSTLVLEGTGWRDRLLVKFHGKELPLTPKSFKFLAKLAGAKLLGSDGWLHKDMLEPGFNQARYIYNLKKELGLSHEFDLLENNRNGYYRLKLAPAQIQFNLGALKSLPDFEIQQLAERLERTLLPV